MGRNPMKRLIIRMLQPLARAVAKVAMHGHPRLGMLTDHSDQTTERGDMFNVGDIVRHRSGRICNGKHGKVVFALGELMVEDNEGALDMPVSGNEDALTVVGTIKDNPELLEEFV